MFFDYLRYVIYHSCYYILLWINDNILYTLQYYKFVNSFLLTFWNCYYQPFFLINQENQLFPFSFFSNGDCRSFKENSYWSLVPSIFCNRSNACRLLGLLYQRSGCATGYIWTPQFATNWTLVVSPFNIVYITFFNQWMSLYVICI